VGGGVVPERNRGFPGAIAAGTFRGDLYYRLAVVPLVVPALRERPEDLALLADHFLALIAKSMGRKPRRLERGALAVLARHGWPGNVRELRNLLERLVILTPGETITEADIARQLPGLGARPEPEAVVGAVVGVGVAPDEESESDDDPEETVGSAGSLKAQLDAAERVAIEEALRQAGSVARAAELLDLERSHLYKKLRKHRLPY